VVYSAHLSPYGAIPANLQRSPGTRVHVHLLYMTEAQLGLISATEPNYELCSLPGAECHPAGGEAVSAPSAYLSRHGCLLLDGAEAALTAVRAEGRTFPALSEPQVLERVRRALCPEEGLDAFVLANVTDPALSRSRTARLARRPSQVEAKRRRASRARKP
jgi:hypothetical protein